MKTLFVILVLSVAVALAANWSDFKSTGPKNFPPQFTATFNETDLASPSGPRGVKTLYYDSVNKRARETLPGKIYSLKEVSVQYKAPGAEPGSLASNGYTMLAKRDTASAPNGCYYQSVGDSSTPFHQIFWWSAQPDNWKEEYLFNFEYPQMTYTGIEYVSELGIFADRWDSVKRCNLQQSGFGEMPCSTVFQTRDGLRYTVKEIMAHGAKIHSYDFDRYLVRVFLSFKPSVSDSDFAWPQNWQLLCGYADSGFKFPTYTNIYAEASNSNFTFSLTAPPVQGLDGGKVEVTFVPTVAWAYKCTDCVKMSAPTLTFDMTNWNVPQTVFLDYVSTGCEMLTIKARGGGYDWQSTYNNVLYLWSCHLDPTSGLCKENDVCNNS